MNHPWYGETHGLAYVESQDADPCSHYKASELLTENNWLTDTPVVGEHS